MATALTFGTTILDSGDLISLNISQEFKINELPTINSQTITNPGNLSPRMVRVTARFTNNAGTKFNTWFDLFLTRALENLTMPTRTLGLFYFSSINIDATELANDRDFLRLDVTLEFTQYFNFSS